MSDTVKIRFANKTQGNGASVDIPANGYNQPVKTYLEKTSDGRALIKVGTVDEVDLVGNFTNAKVDIKNKSSEVATATGTQTSKQFSAISVDNITVNVYRNK